MLGGLAALGSKETPAEIRKLARLMGRASRMSDVFKRQLKTYALLKPQNILHNVLNR